MHAEDNDDSEAKVFAPEEEEPLQPYTQLERRVVSVPAPHKPEGGRFGWINCGSFFSRSFTGYPESYFERHRNHHGANRRRSGQEDIEKEKQERWKLKEIKACYLITETDHVFSPFCFSFS